MTTGVIDGTEEAALSAGGGPETLVPGYPWQVETIADTLSSYAAALTDTATALARIEITDWAGPTATAAHTRLGQEPTRWATAADALDTAAQVMRRYAAAFPPARTLADQAKRLYDDYVTACLALADTLAAATASEPPRSAAPGVTSTRTGIGDRIALLMTASTHPLTHDAACAAETLRRNAVDDLARARNLLRTAGDDAVTVVQRAMIDAPAARTFWQGTIREPGAEGAAHTGLDGLSMIPGYVGWAALGVNASWYYSEGRGAEAGGTLAAGVIPLMGKGLARGLAMHVATDAIPDGVRLTAAFTAQRIASGHAWTKHVITKGEFPEVSTPQQLSDLVEDVLLTGEARASTAYPGKVYYWKEDTFVVVDPKNPDGGTVFRPKQGRDYYEDQE